MSKLWLDRNPSDLTPGILFFLRFIVKKEAERSEVKVQEGPEGFSFLKNEKYVFKYSFRAKEEMKVAKRFNHLDKRGPDLFPHREQKWSDGSVQ